MYNVRIYEVLSDGSLQQYLPLAVLKHYRMKFNEEYTNDVATVLTACGIETKSKLNVFNITRSLQQYLPLAVLKRSI